MDVEGWGIGEEVGFYIRYDRKPGFLMGIAFLRRK